MRKRIPVISTCMVMFVMFCAVILGACGCQAEKKNITLTITPATWTNEGYTITNPDYKFEDIEDGGKKVVFDYKKKAMDITLYVKANEGYVIDNAVMRAVTTNYLNNDSNYQSFAIEKGAEGKITIKSVDQDIVLIIERVRRVNMFIYFDAMGGEYTDSNPLYVFGEMGSTSSASAPTNPTYENHKFVGWYTMKEVEGEQVYDTLYDFDTITLVPDITLYAKWIEKSTLTFDSKGGSVVPSQELYDEVALIPSDPTKEHHQFDGWYTTENYEEGTKFDFTQPITTDTTLYAKWIEGKDFTFYLNDGSVGEDQTPTIYHTDTVYDTVVDKPTDPTREGYRFAGWYTEETCEHAFDFNTVVSANTKLYAKWVEQITISFVTKNVEDNISSQVIDIHTKASQVSALDIVEKGMTLEFTGWALTEEVVENEELINFDEYLFDTDCTLYARYAVISGYNIYFHELDIIDLTPNKGITFPDYDDMFYVLDESYVYVPVEHANNLKVDVMVKDNFEANTLVMNITNYENNASIEPISGVQDETNTNLFHFTINEVTEVLHIRFSAEAIQKHTISFYKNEGVTLPDGETEKEFATKIAYHDDVLPEFPNAPSRGVEYKFDGWYKEKECTTKYDITEKVTTDFALYAKWIEGKKVTFYLNDGSETQKEWKSVYTYGEAVTEPTDKPTREGYRFDYWANDVEGAGIYNFSHVVTENLSLYAQWVKNITISFQTKVQEEEIPSQTIDINTGITSVVAGNYLSSDLEDEAVYVFRGWSLTDNSEEVLDLSTTKFEKDTTLYAVYTKKEELKIQVQNLNKDIIETVGYFDSLNIFNDLYDEECYWITGREAQDFTIEIRITSTVAENLTSVTLVTKDFETGQEIARFNGERVEGEGYVYAFDVKVSQDAKLTIETKRGI